MCGIAGVWRFHQEQDDRAPVQSMLDSMRARGPDGEGLERLGPLTLGHRRLKILDLSESGRQPMASASGRFVISFNGEIYNFRDLARDLGAAPQSLRSSTDTEIILLAWERWGSAAPDRLVGQWAFALYDREEHRLWLCRDRFGEKPLFYHHGSGALAFASSISALFRAPWVPRQIDPDALAEYLTLRYVVSPRTVVDGIEKLPPGHLLTAGPEGVGVRQWYDARFRPRPNPMTPLERCNLIDEFGALLNQAARRCMVSDVPVGLLLSDGIDSNSIRSTLALSGHDVPSFTYRMVDSKPKVSPAVSLIPTGPRTTDLLVTPEERFRHLLAAFSSFTEPVGDGASLAIWLLIRGARSRATVFLSGSGGDEVLGGYRLDQDRLRLAAIRRFAWLPEPMLRKVLARHTYGRETAAVRRTALRTTTARMVPAISRYLVNRPLPADEVDRLFGHTPAPGSYLGVVDRLYGECGSDLEDLDRIQEVMLRTFLSENILSYSDSVAMSSSAELRLPFLDRDLVNFVLRLPRGMRVKRWPWRTNTKVILHQWGDGRLKQNGRCPRKRTFNYGSIRELLAQNGTGVRDLILGADAVRKALPGLEKWVAQPPKSFRGSREGTLWALLTLGVWGESAGVR